MSTIETDFLVIGAGATGMAFTDALTEASDADVVMVDRRHRPGGHWNDAYPFVRLHMPSAIYGVNSRQLGNDTIDKTGPNAGYYEVATAAEICNYYQRVLENQFLPSGQVRFFGLHDYISDESGEHRIVSRLTGKEQTIRVRRKVVDATYLESSVPATHTPSFEVDSEAMLVSPNDLVNLDQPATGYTVIGAGKTAMDTCNWLLGNSVDPDAIRWIKPREAWVLDRGHMQPLDLVPMFFDLLAGFTETAAQAENIEDLYRRLEAGGLFHRLDTSVEPTMHCLATLSQAERDSLRRIENVVRLGRVQNLGADKIALEEGSMLTDKGQVHIDCTARGLRPRPACAIFEPDRIRIQPIRTGFPHFNAAFIGYVEATREDDADKNRLCPPNPYPNHAYDWISNMFVSIMARVEWSREPDIEAWLEKSRLNAARGAANHMQDPKMQQAVARLSDNTEPGLINLKRFMAEIQATAPANA